MESEELFEGDIMFNKDNVSTRTVSPGSGWPRGVMLYRISPELIPYKNLIQGAMQAIASKTCVKFREAGSNDRSYVNYQNRNYGCYSNLGKQPFPQTLNLGGGCLSQDIIIHETMHALGFWHEQNRQDRDKYIKILWENIKPEGKSEFQIKNPIDHLGTPYDYCSIMHYYDTAFSKNGLKTMEPVKPLASCGSLGNGMGKGAGRLSSIDIKRLNKFYNCNRPRPI